MGVAKMRYVNVYGPEKMLAPALAKIAHSGCFAPESNEAIKTEGRLGQNRFEPMLAKAKGLLKDLGHSGVVQDYSGDENKYTAKEAEEYLEKFAAEVARRSKRKTDIEAELDVQLKTQGLLSHMKDLDVNIDDLFTVETLKVRFGRLPKESYTRLSYYAEKGLNFTAYFNFIVYDFDGEFYWGIYFAPADSGKDIDDIFKGLYFERVWVPEFVYGTPEQALDRIHQKEMELRRELAEILTTEGGIATKEEQEKIEDLASWIAMMNQLYEMRRYAFVFNHTFYISGFVPQSDYPCFDKLVEDLPGVHIKEDEKKEEVPAKPPVKLKNGWFSRPYEMYTEMYGLPGQGDIDPTGLVAILYSVLYGLMFADLGQGLVLGIVGYFIMYKKKGMAIGRILTRAAIFSCIFGVLFGSVFGLEHLLNPVWAALGVSWLPFNVMGASSINMILAASVSIGVFVVSLSIITNIFVRIRKKQWGSAFVGPNGVAGLLFYLSVVLLVADKMFLNLGLSFVGSTPYIICFIVIPGLLIYFQEPFTQLLEEGKIKIESVSDLILGGFFEMFVTVLEYLSNTVSFLRVGGFVLVHAGMMSVVLTLAEMGGAIAYPIVMVIGNVFVICLEGLIVGIQALRLNYFEVFSRFYDADGEAFAPLKITTDTVEM